MILPTDTPPALPPPGSDDIIDTDPIITDEQREKAHRSHFQWNGNALNPWSLEREIFWREFRAHIQAPEIALYKTVNDFLPEALRIIWVASLSQQEIEQARHLTIMAQVALQTKWSNQNVTLHTAAAAAELGYSMWESVQLMRTQALENPQWDSLGE